MAARGINGGMRSFIAIDLPPAHIEAISSLQEELKKDLKGVRWVKSNNIHLTLKFLGDVQEGLLDELGDILTAACASHASFELSAGRPGAFPSLKRPRVIWLGLEGELEKLNALKQDIEEGCLSAGVDEEKRSFHPHLTLGRVRDPGQGKAKVAGLFDRPVATVEGAFPVNEVHLYRSDLTPHGAVYTRLKSFPLKQEK